MRDLYSRQSRKKTEEKKQGKNTSIVRKCKSYWQLQSTQHLNMHFNKLACIYTEKDTSEMRNTHEFPFYFDLKVATQVLTKESNTSQNITYKNQVPSHIVRI